MADPVDITRIAVFPFFSSLLGDDPELLTVLMVRLVMNFPLPMVDRHLCRRSMTVVS